MEHQKIKHTFKYPVLNDKNHQYGASILQSPILKEDGDWRTVFAEQESQQRNGVEQSSCYIQAQQHAIQAIENVKFGEKNSYDARFNALLSNGTDMGGDPVAGADSIRHDGMIPEGAMGYDYATWAEYHSWKGADEVHCKGQGNADIYLYDRRFGVIITKEMPLATKYAVLREALKRSPVSISLYALPDGKGSYVPKPKGVGDTHLVMGLVVSISADNCLKILDTYEPFGKKLPANYNMDFGVMWTVEKKINPEVKKKWLDGLIAFFRAFLSPQESAKVISDITPIFVPTKTNTEVLLEALPKWIGTDLSPDNVADKSVACAEGMSVGLHSLFPSFPKGVVSTKNLKKALDLSPLFKPTLTPKAGAIVVSPRTETVNGHCGFFITDERIVSNDSKSGLMQDNYSWASWIKTFKDGRGLRTFLFELK